MLSRRPRRVSGRTDIQLWEGTYSDSAATQSARKEAHQAVHFASLFAEATVRSMKRTPRAPSSTRG